MSITQTIRAFIAIELPANVKATLGKVSEELGTRVPGGSVRWVKPAQMHLTLHFLGDTPVEKLPAVQQALDGITGHYESFVLRLGRTGCFPNCRQPRVIWVGLESERVETGDSLLHRLKQELDSALRPLGWEPDKRPFRAHLTLGRVKDSNQVRNVSWTAGVPPLPIPVTALYLIQSDLRPDGPIYTIRHSAFLTR